RAIMSTDTDLRFSKKALESVQLPLPGSRFNFHGSEAPGQQHRVTDCGIKSLLCFPASKRAAPERVSSAFSRPALSANTTGHARNSRGVLASLERSDMAAEMRGRRRIDKIPSPSSCAKPDICVDAWTAERYHDAVIVPWHRALLAKPAIPRMIA